MEEALLKTIELLVDTGVIVMMSPGTTPAAVQLATEVELASVAGRSTVQEPNINFFRGVPLPMETAVPEALNSGNVVAVLLAIKTEERVAAPVTARVLERVAAPVTVKVSERVVAPVTAKVLETVKAAVETSVPTVVAKTIPAVAKVVTSVAIATCNINFDLMNFFISFN